MNQVLTDEEIGNIGMDSQDGISPHEDMHSFARAIESAVLAKLDKAVAHKAIELLNCFGMSAAEAEAKVYGEKP